MMLVSNLSACILVNSVHLRRIVYTCVSPHGSAESSAKGGAGVWEHLLYSTTGSGRNQLLAVGRRPL